MTNNFKKKKIMKKKIMKMFDNFKRRCLIEKT